MDSEHTTLEASAKALGLISMIPVILFALWADAIERSIKESPKEYPSAELENESNKLKLISVIIIIFQLSLYLEASPIRQAYPLLSLAILIFSVSLQGFVQYHTDETLFPDLYSSESLFVILVKLVRAWTLGILICSFFLTLFLQAGYFISKYLQLRAELGSMVLIFSSTLAMILGLVSNYALAPFHIRKTLPHEQMKDHEFCKSISDLFTQYSLPMPKIWRINLEKLRIIDLSVLGVQQGKSIFQFSLFVSKSALENLSEHELQALLKTELSHILLKHPTKKLIYSCTLLLGSTLLAILGGLATLYILNRPDLADGMGMGIGFVCFFISFRWIGIKSRYFEFEADIYVVKHLKVDFEVWASALRRLDILMLKQNPNFENYPFQKDQGLPETEQRIRMLATYLKHSPSTPSESPPLAQAG
jgi:Zn-dependent protease with chaperone function